MNQYEDLLIDLLLDYGFTLEEATRLIRLRERMERQRRRQALRDEDAGQPGDEPRER
ncbi:MAG: hypothetical protein KGO05_00615 [Chloroflexota bacterium]|nr:hypothetical protein [Chloroflexota bacterium]